MDIGKLDYRIIDTPPGYKCDVCGQSGLKLWREYNTFADHTKLLCAEHACADQNKDDNVDDKGYSYDDLGRSDQIGWMIPAVPTQEGDTYWGYTSVPQEGVIWWKSLSTRKDAK